MAVPGILNDEDLLRKILSEVRSLKAQKAAKDESPKKKVEAC
jgi:hypothetical protein